MFQTLQTWLQNHSLHNQDWLVTLIMIGFILVTALIIHVVLHMLLFRWLGKQFKNSKSILFNVLAEQRLFTNIGYTIQGIVLGIQLRIWLPETSWQELLITLTEIWSLIFALLAVFALLDTINNYLFRRNLAQHFPVKGLVQTVKLIASIGIGILLVSILLGKSPVILLSGLGAMTAVLMLVFKDPILGLVAGIQLSANRMLNVGDWLEMGKYNADGSVIDIGLTTVKVQNWDNTVTTIPTYALISDSFKNWRAMSESGGRRIKRAVYIDSSSVKFLSPEEVQKLSESQLLTDYLTTRSHEIAEFNRQHNIQGNSPLNGRHLTNLGTFRAYLQRYLENNPHIRKDMTLMVRQLDPNEQGIPLEVYCFTNTVLWGEYEAIQADIFDHIFAVVAQFGLHIYQAPSGYDLRNVITNLRQSKD
ncbi:mechanosensitive ion channel family protein [Volucribacter amazonae]|uniref:Mechanosensing system component YbdG n=1 Tax=Volucribacter amazonae TaxID=256731 RepID=A0A9X4SQL8_9PAST|nr:mechanosensitive ion channel domain-containing protein [Volucribacter amazonae]MDG6895511.1 miniconductance mechanosensitive channel [Volucribacter amazonae]